MVKINLHMSRVFIESLSGPTLEKRDKVHKILWRGFNHHPHENGAKQPFLYRIERESVEGMEVIIQSSLAPRWEGIAGLVSQGSKAIVWNISAGDKFYFRLNSVFREARVIEGKDVKFDIKNPNVAEKKLYAQSGMKGFALDSITSTPTCEQLKTSKGRKMKINSHLMDGEITVVDPAIFSETLKDGLGKNKCYGFGWMSIVR